MISHIGKSIATIAISTAVLSATMGVRAESAASPRKAVLESRITLPEYFGFYAVQSNGDSITIENLTAVDEAPITLSSDVEFLIYGKNTNPESIQLLAIPSVSPRGAAQVGESSFFWHDLMKQTNVGGPQDMMAAFRDAPDESRVIKLLVKPVSKEPQMLRFIPAESLSVGFYQIASPGEGWHRFAVGSRSTRSPSPDDNDICAEFLSLRSRQILAKSRENGGEIPREYTVLLRGIESHNWQAAATALVQLEKAFADKDKTDDGLNTLLSQNAHEMFGAFEQFANWHPSLIQTYGRDILRGIPPNSIIFAGTDPGRFIVTAFQEVIKAPLTLVTQNALADNSYLHYLRDRVGTVIRVPSQQDGNSAFQKYVDDVKTGRIPAGADVSFESGRVSVQGVQSVMAINGILARMVFDANKANHEFYVEESYVIPWMYPYLRPAGLIMKLMAEPTELTAQMATEDRHFWDSYTDRLTRQPDFNRDESAQKTYSKMRSAIAGIYANRRMFDEAEYAFNQAIQLYPPSPEANFRLADVYMQQFQFGKARDVIAKYLVQDPHDEKVAGFLDQIKDTEKADTRRRELEAILARGGAISNALELAEIYKRMGLQQLFDGLAQNIINQASLPPNIILQVAQMYSDANSFDRLAESLQKYLQREPTNDKVWLDLAAVYVKTQKESDALQALRRAVDRGDATVRERIRNDTRFDGMNSSPDFHNLISAKQ